MLKFPCIAAALFAVLAGCSKSSDSDSPQVFLPQVISPQGQNLDQAHAAACDPSKVDLTDHVLTQKNFQAMFSCANYDHSLNDLEPLFNSAEFPQLLTSVNAISKSENAKSIHDTLKDWFEDGSDGTSKIDRLLPYLASLIKNPSFQDFLPVLSTFLESGRNVWADLLPGLADVVYTDLFPDNLENAFDIFNSFSPSGSGKGARDEKDYAKSVKDFARFLEMKDVNGKTAAAQVLELADQVRDLEPDGTSLYQFLERMLEFGSIDEYFLNNGNVRGEVVDPKLNENPDSPDAACPNLNDTAEHRQECANQRMYQRPSDGADAPLTQLAGLVVEFEKDHPEFLTSLASWFSANGDRVSHGLADYVVRAQVVTNLSKLNVANYLQQFALKSGLDVNAPVTGAQLADLLQKGFASPDFPAWVSAILPGINKTAFGERNAGFLAGSTLAADIALLYQAPEIAAFANSVIPDGQTTQLSSAIRKFSNKHRTDALTVSFRGVKEPVEKQLGDLWVAVVKADLGEDVVLNYVVKLVQSMLTETANDFKDKGQPLSEWYFNAPYGNPATIETLVGYAIKELDLLTKYYENKDWLENDFANEVYGSNDSDKRAFRLLLDQVPNIVLYVRSGQARDGGDLSRALSVDTDGYLTNTFTKLIVKAVNTGWLRKGVGLIEAYHATPEYQRSLRAPMSDDIQDRRQYKLGVEALDRIVRSLIEPRVRDDYATTTLSRLLTPLSTVVSAPRRPDTEKFLLTSADQLLGLTDQQINSFVHDLHTAKPPGEADTRRESYKTIADMMKNKNCPDALIHLSGLFQENAVRPALNFLAQKIDDGSLPKLLRFIRRVLGFGR